MKYDCQESILMADALKITEYYQAYTLHNDFVGKPISA